MLLLATIIFPPEQRKRITVRPKQPWLSDNLAKLKRERRKLGRKWIKSKTEFDQKIYKKVEICLLPQ